MYMIPEEPEVKKIKKELILTGNRLFLTWRQKMGIFVSVHLLRFIKASKGKWDKERKFFFQKRCRMIFLLLLLSILFYFEGLTVGLQILFYTEAVLVVSVFLKICKATGFHRT